MRPGTGEPPALYGLEPATAVAEVSRLGLVTTVRRCDDPLGPRTGPDVVVAARWRDGAVELVVGSTYGWPEGSA